MKPIKFLYSFVKYSKYCFKNFNNHHYGFIDILHDDMFRVILCRKYIGKKKSLIVRK